jgi:hypothetical protein
MSWMIKNIDSISIANTCKIPIYDHPLLPVYASVTCPFCDRLGPLFKHSRTYEDSCFSTCMDNSIDFKDEQGAEHYHDGNYATTECHCDHGHTFELHGTRKCSTPGCDYGSKPNSIRVKGRSFRQPDEVQDITVWPENYGSKFGLTLNFDPQTAVFSYIPTIR